MVFGSPSFLGTVFATHEPLDWTNNTFIGTECDKFLQLSTKLSVAPEKPCFTPCFWRFCGNQVAGAGVADFETRACPLVAVC